jgi:hypothetical protein
MGYNKNKNGGIKMKKFLIGVLVGCLLMMTTPVLADSIFQSIDVVLDSVQVQVNGEKLDANTILYNGSTYLPMRKVAEAVGKDVEWDQETMTANIVEKKVGDISMNNDEFVVYNPNTKEVYGEKNGETYRNLKHIINLIEKYPNFYIDYNNDTQKLTLYKSGDTMEFIADISYYLHNSEIFISENYFNNTILPLLK